MGAARRAPQVSIHRKDNGDLTAFVGGITNERYLRQQRAQAHGVSERAKSLLDGYVRAYDERQRYTGSSIATAMDVDAAYNGMLRREEERARAFIGYITTSDRGGLGRAGYRDAARGWLDGVAQAAPEDREGRRREVLRQVKRLEQDAD
jgi:hypothetical protein